MVFPSSVNRSGHLADQHTESIPLPTVDKTQSSHCSLAALNCTQLQVYVQQSRASVEHDQVRADQPVE